MCRVSLKPGFVDANNGRQVKESHRGLEELASGYNLGVGPFHRKILKIAGHEVVGVCGLGALQEMSSSGSEQACTLSDGLTQNPFCRIARSAWSMIIRCG